MSHFYGTVEGNAQTEATRCGSKSSGITTYAASWDGAVRTCVFYDEKTGKDRVRVEKTTWHGKGKYMLLYEGPIN